MYDYLLFAHILLAIIWVGGGATIQTIAARMRRDPDLTRLSYFGEKAGWVGQRVYLPASILLLLAGIGMVMESEAIGWGDPFIVVGLIGWTFSALVGSLYLGPTAEKLGKMVEEKGPGDPAIVGVMDRLFTVQRIELVVFLVVIFFMVIKPGS